MNRDIHATARSTARPPLAEMHADPRNSSAFGAAPRLAQLAPVMVSPSRRPRIISIASPLLLALLACQPVPQQPIEVTDADGGAADLLARTVPDVQTTLVFPPPNDDRKQRPALAKAEANDKTDPNNGFRVESPTLEEGADSFNVYGQTVSVRFNKPITLPKPIKNGKPVAALPGQLKIEPAVAGKAEFSGINELRFIADKPFDPEQEYTVTLADLQSSQGEALAPWSAKFTAEPRIEMAGKVLSYIPEPGDPGVVEVFPYSGSKLGRTGKLSIVFDQPVKPKQVQDMISLTMHSTGEKIPFRLANATSGRIQGHSLKAGQIIEVRPKSPLPENVEILLGIETPSDADESDIRRQFSIAGPLVQNKVGCGYGYDRSLCDYQGGVLATDGREVTLEYSNRLTLDQKVAKSAISVSPTLANMNVWVNDAWDGGGRINISGAFEPSTEYTIQLPDLTDKFGNTLPATSMIVRTASLPSSVSMPEGVLILDGAASRSFTITSRNVSAGKLRAWLVPDDADALKKARTRVQEHDLPGDEPAVTLGFNPEPKRNEFVSTKVDLLGKFAPGKNYIVTVDLETSAFDARPVTYPSWMSASRSPMALVTPGDDKALAVHTHVTPEATLVHVARLATGEPVPGATFSVGGKPVDGRTTDATGFAVIPVGLGQVDAGLLLVEDGKTSLTVPLRSSTRDARLFPDISASDAPLLGDRRAMVITDRGIYRPGSKVFIKASVRRKLGEQIAPLAATPVRVRVLGPTDDQLADLALVTDDMGSVAAEYDIPAEGRVGRHRIEVSEAADPEKVLDDSVIQVAEFEPPRFTVDVDASLAGTTLRANILGKYLFGAAMDKAAVQWTLTREPAKLPSGPFTDAGFHFYDDRYSWWDDEDEDGEGDGDDWSRAGEGVLGPDGTLAVTQKLDLGDAVGPQEFTFEADVADSSFRHIAGRGSVVVHPTPRYVGVKIDRPWGDVGAAVPVQLGVIDKEGKPIEGASVTARLKLVDWTYSRKPRKRGGYDMQWQRVVKEVGSCTATSARTAVSCELTPPENGSYEVIAEVDGKPGGVTSMWAWSSIYNDDDRKAVPTRGRTLDIIADKARYVPGETAKLMIQNPFPAATVLFTLEQGGLLSHQTLRLDGPAKVFEVPILAGHAPYVHATVTLLPIGAGDERTDWKIGAMRIPVALDDVKLTAAVSSDKPAYEPREPVSITIDVKDKGQPVAGAEIALAVVDEGILRMTNFHAADPSTALRPGQPLRFDVSDSRDNLAALLDHAQTAGDGAGDGTATTSNTRKNFVQTAYWKPDLRTDSNGRATANFTLPDNLTRFRMMAVVIDKSGKGAAAESDFTVRRPVMMVPVVPRFAAVGDQFEAAAMVHNNTDAPLSAKVSMNGTDQQVVIAAQGHQRVGFPLTAQTPGDLRFDFAVRDGSDKVRDSVQQTIPVDVAGLPEHPHIHGAFVGEQRVELKVPQTTLVGRGDEDFVTVQVGQHLWPELGARMQFLLDYPHGCVEQTTSGTLPLLAAKDILPRIGFTGMTQAELDKRIVSGLQRLATMRTSSGGLGYWPGDNTPNVYGTAYAARAVVAAKQAGIKLPDGLLKTIEDYLQERLLSDGIEGEVQAAIAQTLSELGSLQPSAADALFDRASSQGTFGKASLAIALSAIPGQEDRVKQLLDEVEAKFDDKGNLTSSDRGDFYYYGSDTRTRAQAAIALGRLRAGSVLQTKIVQSLAASTDDYTTQSTAFSLLAVAEQLRGQPSDGAAFTVSLGGTALAPSSDLGVGSQEFHIPLADLRGADKTLTLRSDSKAALAFIVRGRWKRELSDAKGLTATTAATGPSVYRIITDARGEAIDLANVKPGQVLRVALLATLPVGDLDSGEMNYLALTDRLPAGFEPIQTDLWTVARAPEISNAHPFADMLRWGGSDASYLELRDDRVYIYFDRVWGERVLASYLVRASTPGTFVLPPAAGEFMYVGDSMGYSSSGTVTVK